MFESNQELLSTDLQSIHTDGYWRDQARLFAGCLGTRDPKSLNPAPAQPLRNRVSHREGFCCILVHRWPWRAWFTNQPAQDRIDESAPIPLQPPDLPLGKLHGFVHGSRLRDTIQKQNLIGSNPEEHLHDDRQTKQRLI